MKFLGFVLDAKLLAEGCIWFTAASASSNVESMRKASFMFGDPVMVLRCFWSFLLPVLEYCSPVWISAASSHLGLLDRVVSKAVRLSDGLVVCDLKYKRCVAALCMFHKI